MAPTTYPPYLREKARQLRRERKLTIDQLAECLALPRTTIYYWGRDLPIPRTERQNRSQRKAVRVTRMKHQRLRETAYSEGQASYAALSDEPGFRDFVVLYIAEGYKRCRNTVSVGNSDPAVVRAVAPWMLRFAKNPVTYWLQYHADQDIDDLRLFWGQELGVDPLLIRVQRKSNSNQLSGRKWRSRYGVLSVVCRDTYFARGSRRGWSSCETTGYTRSPSGCSAAW